MNFCGTRGQTRYPKTFGIITHPTFFIVGGPCEQSEKKGYTVIVDQGFKGEIWMGPQILAHHLLLMLTSDLYSQNDPRRYCPEKFSILHNNINLSNKLDDHTIRKI